jgi:hypothetical protein
MENASKKETVGRIESTADELWWVTDSKREPIGNLVRCFPATSPETCLSLRHAEGNELALIRNLNDLDADSRTAVDPILHEKYHIPTIIRILSVEPSDAGKRIHVETLDGMDDLSIASESDVDFRNYPAMKITDRSTHRKYLIEDATELDKASRELIRRQLRTRRRGRGYR